MKNYMFTVLLTFVSAGVPSSVLHASLASTNFKGKPFKYMGLDVSVASIAKETLRKKEKQRLINYIKGRTLFSYPEKFILKDLSYADLHNASLFNCTLSGSNLFHADLSSAYLNLATLISANLQGANLYKASLGSADMHKANLSHANLSEADLSGAKLLYAVFFKTDLRQAKFDYNTNVQGATGLTFEQKCYMNRFGVQNIPWAFDEDPQKCNAKNNKDILYPKVNNENGNFSRKNLSYRDLHSADFSGLDLTRSILTGTNLASANLTNVNLTGANLTDVNVNGAYFNAGTNVKDAIGLTFDQKCYMHRLHVQNIPWAPGENPVNCTPEEIAERDR